jgi:hypothetical protein
MPDYAKVIPWDEVNNKPITITSHGQFLVVETNYISREAYDSNNNLKYLGKALGGTATASALWQIKEFSYDSSFNLTSILLADGNESFDNVWDNRASLSYS